MPDAPANTVDLVISTIKDYAAENDRAIPVVDAQSRPMADLNLDSLALAEILIELESRTGRDPFADGFVEFTTVAELARLYE